MGNIINKQRLEEMQPHVDKGGSLKCDQEPLNSLFYYSNLVSKIMDDIKEEAMPSSQFQPHVMVLGTEYIESALKRHL